MKHKTLYAFWCLLILTRITGASASEVTDTLQQRLNNYHLEKPYIGLYVHLDKNTYLVGDTIWFKAYVMSTFTNEVLYVRMTDQHKDIVLEKQFSIYDIRSHGDLVIPEDLPEGKYYFYAYTDRMMSLSSGEAFVQPLTVGKNQLHRLEAEAAVVSPRKIHRGDPVEISVKVNGVAGKTLKGTYRLVNEGIVFKEGRITVNSQGYAFIRFNYPNLPDDESMHCDIRFDNEKEFAELSLNLRHEGNTLQLKAYPEGGHLLEGAPARVIIETQDEHNNPLKAVIGLLENGKEVSTTESDTYGLGELAFTPKKDARYRLRVSENDTTYQTDFPCTIEAEGFALRTHKDTKTINTVLYHIGKSDSATLVVRSFNKIVWSQPFQAGKGDSVTLSLPVADLPDGLLNLAVFDTTGLPKTERLIINPKGDNYHIRFTVEKTQKSSGIEAKVTIHVSDREGKPVKANLSVSVVEKSSVNWADYRTIQQAERFKNLTVPLTYNENDKQVDRWLMSKNLARYDWAHVLRYKPTGTIRMLNNPAGITGRIQMKENKPLKNDVLCVEATTIPDLGNVSDLVKSISGTTNAANGNAVNLARIAVNIIDDLQLIKPSENGYFSILPSSLNVSRNQTKILKLRNSYEDVKTIELTDYPSDFDTMVRSGNRLDFPVPFNTVTKYVPSVEKTLNKSIQLKEVSVEARGKGHTDNNMGKKEDYVCSEYNVFNCPNHRVGGKKPEVGTVYSSGERGTPFLYNGVGKRFSPAPEGTVAGTRVYWPITNISSPNTFYQPQITDTTFLKTDIRNTVFWSPNLYTDESGDNRFGFCTSNRKSAFTIIVQGIDSKTRQAIFGRYEFSL